jgi:hypothetical protein
MQIPVFNPGQRIEPSSPVAVGGADNTGAGMEADAQGALGKALFNLGNALDREAKQNKGRLDALNAKLNSETFEQDLLSLKAMSDAEPIVEGDPTGAKATNRFMEQARKLRDLYTQKIGSDSPEALAAFQAGSQQIITQYGTSTLATEVKKRAEAVPLLTKELFNQYNGIVFKDPTKVNEIVQKAELTRRQDSNIAPKDLPAMLSKDRTGFLSSTALGIIERAKDPKNDYYASIQGFGMARKVVTENMHLLTEEGRDKLLAEVDREQTQFVQQSWTTAQHVRQIKEDRDRDMRNTAKSNYVQQLSLAGNDDNKVQEILGMARKDQALMTDNGQAYQELVGANIYKDAQDDSFQQKFMSDLIQQRNPNYRAADLQLDAMQKAGKLSQDRAIKLQQMVRDMRTNDTRNPAIKDVVSATEKRIKASYGMFKPDPLGGPPIEVFNAEGAQKVQAFYLDLARRSAGGNYPSPDTVAGIGAPYIKNEGIRPVTGLTPDQSATPTGVQQTKDEILKDYLKNGSKWSPQLKKQKLEQIKQLNNNASVIQQNEALKVQRPQPSVEQNKTYKKYQE